MCRTLHLSPPDPHRMHLSNSFSLHYDVLKLLQVFFWMVALPFSSAASSTPTSRLYSPPREALLHAPTNFGSQPPPNDPGFWTPHRDLCCQAGSNDPMSVSPLDPTDPSSVLLHFVCSPLSKLFSWYDLQGEGPSMHSNDPKYP